MSEVAVKPKNCGVTSYDHKSAEFTFDCGFKEGQAVTHIPYPESLRTYDCEIIISDIAKPANLVCKARTITFDPVAGNG